MRRRIVSRGFEGLELPQARGWRPVGGEDVELLQGGELPRRRLVSQAPERDPGPAAFGQPFKGGRGLLDRPDAQNIGRSAPIILSGAGSTNAANILNLVGDDQASKVVTISLMAELINPQVADYLGDPRALITWGSGGVQYLATVDFMNGAVIQLCCSALRIDVRTSGQGTAKFSAHVGYGATGEKTAQRTIDVTTSVGMGVTSAAIPVPNFARTVQLVRRPTTANCSLFFGWTSVFGALECLIGNGPGSCSEVFKIPNGVRYVWLVNGNGAAISQHSYIFGLCL